MTTNILRNTFDVWYEFTRKKKEKRLKESLLFDSECIEDLVKTLENLYESSLMNSDFVSNVLLEETISKFKEAHENLEILIKDIKKI